MLEKKKVFYPGGSMMKRFTAMVLGCALFTFTGCGSSDSTNGETCPTGQIKCGEFCVDPLTDRANCGASGDCLGANAGTACASGFICDTGTCELSCQAGLINCDGTCIDPDNNPDHCGASNPCSTNPGTACADGTVCNGAGSCTSECAQGRVKCGNSCIDPTTDRAHCGASGNCLNQNAGVACEDGFVCKAGQCELSCQEGLVNCDGTCIDPEWDPVYCGAFDPCGQNSGTVCLDGYACVGGLCELNCQAGFINCGGTCIDPYTDRNYCGASDPCADDAGVACGDGFVCESGECKLSCQEGLINCDGTCIDPDTDRGFCGASDNCLDANRGTACEDGFVCDGAGICALSCQASLLNCGGACINPLLDRTYCGASGDCQGANDGTTCANYEYCDQGQCRYTPTAIRPNLLLCGASDRDVRTFIPPGITLNLVSSCEPDNNTQAMLVSRDGAGINAATLKSYLDNGGIVLTEWTISDEIFNLAFGTAVAEGGSFGSCNDIAPTVFQFSPSDLFWKDTPFTAIPAGSSGCGRDVSAFPGITPLAGWDNTHVAIAYRNRGYGRLWLTDFDWYDTEVVGAGYAYTNSLMGYMITHRNPSPPSCLNNPQWIPVTCTTPSWVWSSNRAIAQTVPTAAAARVLETGCSHGGATPQPAMGQGMCSLDGKGWVSTQTFTMSGCNANWWHLGGSYTGACGGHDGDLYRHLVLNETDCYNY
jgi:hypothetical protein